MSEYSYSDINEAKRRVQEMKNRAKEQNPEVKSNDLLSLLTSQKSKKDRAFLLSLTYLLREESDEKLINAIISILFN